MLYANKIYMLIDWESNQLGFSVWYIFWIIRWKFKIWCSFISQDSGDYDWNHLSFGVLDLFCASFTVHELCYNMLDISLWLAVHLVLLWCYLFMKGMERVPNVLMKYMKVETFFHIFFLQCLLKSPNPAIFSALFGKFSFWSLVIVMIMS